MNERIAVLIPALNEEQTIAEVVHAFQAACPRARIVVFDNASTDGTARSARAAGAEVRLEPRRGKGHVVQSMFRTIDADVYVMVDGDATYPADRIDDLIHPILDGSADMVIGSRLHRTSESDFRALNLMGNIFYATLLRGLFGVRITDLLSGYRAFSRRVVKTLPLVGGGFETEAEMTIKAVHRGFRVLEVPVSLTSRPHGSASKIRIVQDGLLILNAIVSLFRDYKPLTFFGALALVLAATASLAWLGGSPIGAIAFALTAAATAATGAVLHTVTRHFQQLEVMVQRMVEEREEREQREERSIISPDEARPPFHAAARGLQT
ncbi:MAG TPA: glycosyltransferase [Thermoanaerobaculia bacterium]|nr:glycosyltransferase [Thermoanaerobaculia bacterium]